MVPGPGNAPPSIRVRLDGVEIAMYPIHGGWAGTNKRGTRLIEVIVPRNPSGHSDGGPGF